ncbi:hypothetical protein AAVH_21835, partial [Aphelenchoides avenae]
MVLGGIGAFKSVKNVCVESSWSGAPLNENFFITAVHRGVRHIELKSADGLKTAANTAAALLLGFAEPAAGGERALLGVACGIGPGFLAQVKQKVAELDGDRHVDFKFKLSDGRAVTSTMSKSQRNLQLPAAGSEGLVERVEASANDDVRLCEIVESSGSVADAFAVLLAGSSRFAPNGSRLRKKTHNRPLPAESFVEVVLFADRDTLDAMQLTCSVLFNIIKERELKKLALRTISEVVIGRHFWQYSDELNYWLPSAEIVYGHGDGQMSVPKTVHQLTSFLRVAFCESVCIDFMGAPGAGRNGVLVNVCGMVFDETLAPSTFAGMLHVRVSRCSVELAARGIVAFKSVKNVCVESSWSGAPLNENFFIAAVHRGVRHIELKSADGLKTAANTAAALSFGFAEPVAGGDRSLLGVFCEVGADFLAHVKQ